MPHTQGPLDIKDDGTKDASPSNGAKALQQPQQPPTTTEDLKDEEQEGHEGGVVSVEAHDQEASATGATGATSTVERGGDGDAATAGAAGMGLPKAIHVALNTHGTRAVQKLVETLRSPEQVNGRSSRVCA